MSGPSHSPPRSQHPLSPKSPSPALSSHDLDAQKPKLSASGYISNSSSTSPPADYSSKISAILTPPSSVPMSAQSSITSQPVPSIIPSSNAPPGNKEEAKFDLDGDTDMGNLDNNDQSQGAKRKLECIEEEEVYCPSKRARTEEREQQPVEEANKSPAYVPVGPPPIHLAGTQTYAPSRPHASQNLISLYNLDDVSLSVARKDPVTGEKINKLRKSYENKIKDFPGKNKSVSAEPRILLPMAQCPELEWNVYHGGAYNIERGLPDDMMAKLDKALDMGPGKLPADENDKWRNFLDVGENNIPAKANALPKASSKGSKVSGTQNTNNQASPTSPTRPSRRGTKRSYHDQSFEGYGEGYVDDIADAGAYDEGDNGQTGPTAKKRRKRDTSGVASPPLAGGMHQYSSSAVSVGGSGLHGR
ncbi:MAG: hypothetical protein M1831_005885 [Alyxoria varia]|nr:MAG: hypothetical protein M1831_005885 [Alyxoria varia]